MRSDTERKRILTPDPGRSSHGIGEGLYSAEANDLTYARLLTLAETVMAAGFTVIVDASFLEARRRADFRALADRLRVPWVLLCCEAEPERLRERVVVRAAEGRDPSDAGLEVLDAQLRRLRPIGDEEAEHALAVRTDGNVDMAAVVTRLDTMSRS